MNTKTNVMTGAYLAKGIIGNIGMSGAPIVHFSLVVVPSQHKVNGIVEITSANQGSIYKGEVSGTIYSAGLGKITQIVALYGAIKDDKPSSTELPFEAHLAIDGGWEGVGGFNYGSLHVENVPVTASN